MVDAIATTQYEKTAPLHDKALLAAPGLQPGVDQAGSHVRNPAADTSQVKSTMPRAQPSVHSDIPATSEAPVNAEYTARLGDTLKIQFVIQDFQTKIRYHTTFNSMYITLGKDDLVKSTCSRTMYCVMA